MILLTTAVLLAQAVHPAPDESRAHRTNRWGACVGELCMDAGPPSEEVLLAFFGPGQLDEEGTTRCYKQDAMFVALTADEGREVNRQIRSIYVGSRPLRDCGPSTEPTTPFRGFATPEGLSVGDPEARVKELYGASPSFKLVRDRSGLRTTVTFLPCSPECPSLRTRIDIVAGQVQSIRISVME